MRYVYAFFFVLFFLVGVLFATKNPQGVVIHFYPDLQWQTSLAIALIAAAGIGVLLGAVGSAASLMRTRAQLALRQREIRAMEQEVTNLRALPIRDAI
ncbi:MAG: lipopolysaccharide assembly protein LapA domain-containing protein [Gammaproteobacteria bacterium]|nr:lipopolysaccharide assembly protein LapA domain-containing protein [Gammaproteobacteria bacterium]